MVDEQIEVRAAKDARAGDFLIGEKRGPRVVQAVDTTTEPGRVRIEWKYRWQSSVQALIEGVAMTAVFDADESIRLVRLLSCPSCGAAADLFRIDSGMETWGGRDRAGVMCTECQMNSESYSLETGIFAWQRRAPVAIMLACPACGGPHVDAPEPENGWDNPPHKSHKCHHCGVVFRPSDMPTVGVAGIETRGSRDTYPGEVSKQSGDFIVEHGGYRFTMQQPGQIEMHLYRLIKDPRLGPGEQKLLMDVLYDRVIVKEEPRADTRMRDFDDLGLRQREQVRLRWQGTDADFRGYQYEIANHSDAVVGRRKKEA